MVFLSLFVFIGCGEEPPRQQDVDHVDNDEVGSDADIVFETATMACNYDFCTDKTTGLMWHRNTEEQPFWSNDAPAVCGESWMGGFHDWRLPTIDELRTIIYGCPATMPGGACAVSEPGCTQAGCSASCEGCAANAGPSSDGLYWEPDVWHYTFNGTPVMMWSSTVEKPDIGPQVPVPDYGPTRWAVHFASGAIYLNEGASALWVRCVRDTVPVNDDDTLPDIDPGDPGAFLACSHEGLNNCLNNWVVKCQNGQYAFMKDCGEQECKVTLGDPGCVDVEAPDQSEVEGDEDTLTGDEDELVPDEDEFYDEGLADE